jgi:predicted short-subunit dehydrogenase-like oxidoreductase (DUF2520 family)
MGEIANIILIGSGNVATHIARVCKEKNINVLQVYSPHIENARALGEHFNIEALNDINNLNKSADLYIIAVKDDAIAELNQTLRIPDKIVVHTSGTSDIEALKDISGKTGVFYPLQTFTKNRPVVWQDIPLCIEGSDTETKELLVSFAKKFSGSVLEIDSQRRRKLHLSAVFANNFINFLLRESKDVLGSDLPFSILYPLVMETVKKAFEIGPENAQTGPALRGDQKTIEAHLKLLNDNPSAKELYTLFNSLISNPADR